ncbi:hypothetical protein CAL26_04955 [Bordetella genomosp. 9]|uniref:Uncharacterized protein n=1 Tax=Bordetella genomosp. 9 TaxID=1416803 RepID=A0A261RQV7_9BORD|nr:hypothetical protein [Bordetella genomosp. 9]OZI26673.1 hypothetical protein CAL26_04955 [Bordetella genomosp. 9]
MTAADDKELLRRAAKAAVVDKTQNMQETSVDKSANLQCSASGVHHIMNACMFRDDCRAMQARIDKMNETIKALDSRVVELEAALRPFAKDAAMWSMVSSDYRPMFFQLAGEPDPAKFTVGDLRRAAAALGGDK